MASKHDNLMQQHHLLFTEAFPESRIFRRDTGLYYLPNGTPIRVGIPGMGDSWGIIKIKDLLIHLEFEYKVGKDIQSKDQKNWQSMIESLSGIYQLIDEKNNTPLLSIERLKELISARINSQ